MEVKCPECGQRIRKKGLKAGQTIECPACFYTLVVPQDYVEEQLPTDSAQNQEYYRNKNVRTNTILEKGALVDKTNSRRAFIPIKNWQYVIILVGLLIGAGSWVFLKLEESLRSTFMSNMEFPQQQIFAGFLGLASATLIWIGARRQLWPFRLLAIIALVGMPFSISEKALPTEGILAQQERPILDIREVPSIDEEKKPLPANIDDYTEVELEPLFEDITKYGAYNVLGLWIRGLKSSDNLQVSSYLRRMSQIKEDPKFYPREDGALYIILRSPISFQEFSIIAENLGTTNFKDDRSRLLDIQLKPDIITNAPDMAVLQNPDDRNFIENNYKELNSLDMRRIEGAAARLAKAEVKNEKRDEITNQLIKLIQEPWGFDTMYVSALGSALAIWAKPDNANALELVAYVTRSLGNAKREIPNEMVNFLLSVKHPETADAFMPSWMNDPYKWEDLLISLGPQSEPFVLTRLQDAETTTEIKSSALRILERIGTARSLPVLKEIMEQKDNTDLANLSIAAIRKIEEREAAANLPAPGENNQP